MGVFEQSVRVEESAVRRDHNRATTFVIVESSRREVLQPAHQNVRGNPILRGQAPRLFCEQLMSHHVKHAFIETVSTKLRHRQSDVGLSDSGRQFEDYSPRCPWSLRRHERERRSKQGSDEGDESSPAQHWMISSIHRWMISTTLHITEPVKYTGL